MEKTLGIKLDDYQRQIHLDFHTSPYINDVGRDFEVGDFVGTLKAAHVNSINIFAKCHHGMCYYPTKSGVQHPALKGRDMFGEMLEALKRAGIRTTAYTTIVWEEDVAHRFPAWRQMKKDGTFANLETSADGVTKQPAGWKFNNFLHPEYQDYFEAHLKELFEYDVDGFWLDILFLHPKGGWSEEGIKFREKHGLMEDSPKNQIKMESLAQGEFAERFTGLVKANKPNASIFYNTPNNRYVEGSEGIFRKSYYQTHYEVESLPSGFWGYYHFPRIARHLIHKGKDWNGMTGKFQKMWGDFGGIKPKAALEYECFRTQALGGANCVGDQLHPRGILDRETYDLIGHVYKQVAVAEPFYKGSENVPSIGVICPNNIGQDENETGKSEEGVCLMLEELHYDYAVLDDGDPLDKFELLILPDSVVVTEALHEKLAKYSGKIITSFSSGMGEDCTWKIEKLPAILEGPVDKYPTYWSVNSNSGWEDMGERVVYQQGMQIRPLEASSIWVDRILPYFKRSDLKYSSHFQTPPDSKDEKYPAVMGGDDWAVFADPIFKEYRQSGNIFVRDIFKKVLQRLIGNPIVGEGLSPAIEVYPRRKGETLLLTLLHYIPNRKALDIDVIEEGQGFYGQVLDFGKPVKVHDLLADRPLKVNEDGKVILPDVKGRLILSVKKTF